MNRRSLLKTLVALLLTPFARKTKAKKWKVTTTHEVLYNFYPMDWDAVDDEEIVDILKHFSIHNVVVETHKDGTLELKAIVKLNEGVYPHGIPLQIGIKVSRDKLLDDWPVSFMRLVGVIGKERTWLRSTSFPDDFGYEYEVLWAKSPQVNGGAAYELEIYLRPDSQVTEEAAASIGQDIMNGKGLTVFDPRFQ